MKPERSNKIILWYFLTTVGVIMSWVTLLLFHVGVDLLGWDFSIFFSFLSFTWVSLSAHFLLKTIKEQEIANLEDDIDTSDDQ
jgi:hypothetical protein